jgi:hypothetical protein
MAHFKQRMPHLQFATPHSLLQMRRGSGTQSVASLEWLIPYYNCLIFNLEPLVSSKLSAVSACFLSSLPTSLTSRFVSKAIIFVFNSRVEEEDNETETDCKSP